MARYIHSKTGAVIDTDCQMLGDWVLNGTLPVNDEENHTHDVTVTAAVVEPPKVDEPPKQEPIAPPVTAPANTTGADDAYDSITVPQIKQELDAFGIEYDKRSNKQVLYDLMMAQGK